MAISKAHKIEQKWNLVDEDCVVRKRAGNVILKSSAQLLSMAVAWEAMFCIGEFNCLVSYPTTHSSELGRAMAVVKGRLNHMAVLFGRFLFQKSRSWQLIFKNR